MFGKKPTTPPSPPASGTPQSPAQPITAPQSAPPKASSDVSAPTHPYLPAVQPTTSGAQLAVPAGPQSGLAQQGGAVTVGAASNQAAPAQPKQQELARYSDANLETADFKSAKAELIEMLLEKADLAVLETLEESIKKNRVSIAANTLISQLSAPLNSAQHELMREQVIDEVLGFGPLEPLLADPNVSDIMVNGPDMVYIEKNGKISLSDIKFSSERHLLNVVQKIVAKTGRRVDETSPMVDARMPDGSRFNAIIPPLALNGSLVSIRKFKKSKMPLTTYVEYDSMSPEMCRFLEICGNIRLNIIVSGGTGSGKTTLLNALSGHIDMGERVITIEDAAELQLHQPHVLRLETRPANSEGTGEITQRQLVKNALRMRPDRIILGEIRGDEVLDVLAAMNTGHEGSMATIHANNPRDCLSRIENLVGLSGITVPLAAMRKQIESALNLIVQVARMRDGVRRITHIEEVVGMEGDTITTQTLFGFKAGQMDDSGKITGKYFCTGIRPRFFDQAIYFNRDKELAACINQH